MSHDKYPLLKQVQSHKTESTSDTSYNLQLKVVCFKLGPDHFCIAVAMTQIRKIASNCNIMSLYNHYVYDNFITIIIAPSMQLFII